MQENKPTQNQPAPQKAKTILRGLASFSFLLLVIETFDELIYITGGAARPSIRSSLNISYAQIGLLLGLPLILNTLLEPILMLASDALSRQRLMIAGGVMLAVSLLLTAGAWSFPVLLLAEVLSRPGSAAFVTLSQATLMDKNPGREPHMMARWSLAGSIGNSLGPLLLAGAFALAVGWRQFYALAAVLGLALVFLLSKQVFPRPPAADQALAGAGKRDLARFLQQLLANLLDGLRSPALVRWVLLEQMADLLLDVFTDYSALYFADVAGLGPVQTSLVIGGLMLAGLLADLALIPLLERLPGRKVVRLSASAALILYPLWLLVPWPGIKILLVFPLRFATLGWYPVLSGETYASFKGRSGTVKAITSLGDLLRGGLVWLVGWIAAMAGLQAAMWLLLLAPISLLLWMPRQGVTAGSRQEAV